MGTISGLILVAVGCFSGASQASELSFERRVEAQAVIERVYHAHRGAAKSFEKTVPRSVLEAKVRRYLERSVALEEFWHTPVTSGMLEREIERMRRGTRMPERLRELFAALENDPVLIRECLARQVLVERLTENFFAWDERIHEATKRDAERLRDRLEANEVDPQFGDSQRIGASATSPGSSALGPRGEASATAMRWLHGAGSGWSERVNAAVTEERDRFVVTVRSPEGEQPSKVSSHTIQKVDWETWWREARVALLATPVETTGVTGEELRTTFTGGEAVPAALPASCPAEESWAGGALFAPESRSYHSAVWTGSEMIVWGGYGTTRENTGARYDPVTDSWTPTSTAGAPSPREFHTAVWTGSEMIVWGGIDGTGYGSTGGRYDPTTDTWKPVSQSGAPEGRESHTATWTGSEMIVWGGFGGDSGMASLNSGGRYDPDTDMWVPMSSVNAPSPRYGHVAVWTGASLVVWGGEPGSTNTGGRYDPASDSWAQTSIVDAPSARSLHTAVWTGSEMIVWGGAGSGYLDTGARYDPVADAWRSTSTLGAPRGRAYHAAAWVGNRMIIWGPDSSGGSYDPLTDTWRSTSQLNAPSLRFGFTMVSSGSLSIVWGGFSYEGPTDITVHKNSGARYDPMTDSWTPIGPPLRRDLHTAVWTGSEMIVWGGFGGDSGMSMLNSGGRYDPTTDSWSSTAVAGAPTGRAYHAAVWTGSEMIIWGGMTRSSWFEPVVYLSTGGRYAPATDSWTQTSENVAPSPRAHHRAVWTGNEMVVWGGSNTSVLITGGRYIPATDKWLPTPPEGAPSGRSGPTAVWTGKEMVIWGGSAGSVRLATGGAFDPIVNVWRPTSADGTPTSRAGHTAVWTGNEMIVWGGYDGAFRLASGARYNPATDSWVSTSMDGDLPTPRSGHSAAWTGREMVVWAGYDGSRMLNDGARYEPGAGMWTRLSGDGAPSPRWNAPAVWDGQAVIVWGGDSSYDIGSQALGNGAQYSISDSIDDDGDGLSECTGDCNDGLASAFPGAPEVCDGLDQNCNGAADDWDADGDTYSVCADCNDADADARVGPARVENLHFDADRATLSWSAVEPGNGGPVVYDVVRGMIAELPVGAGDSETCLGAGLETRSASDPTTPPAGEGYWYLVRSHNACPPGGYGTASGGVLRSSAACAP